MARKTAKQRFLDRFDELSKESGRNIINVFDTIGDEEFPKKNVIKKKDWKGYREDIEKYTDDSLVVIEDVDGEHLEDAGRLILKCM